MLPKSVFLLVSLFFPWLQQAPYPNGMYAEVKANKGMIVLQLEFEKTPMTVANFVGLAEGMIENKALPLGTPFFDRTIFHRVVPGHVRNSGRRRQPPPRAQR